MEWRPTEHLLYELLRLTTFTMSSMAIQNVSNSLRGLALMGIKWDHLPDEFINIALPAIHKNLSHDMIKKEDQQWFAEIIHSLGLMAIDWSMFPYAVQQAIGSAAIDVGPLTDQAMIKTLTGLASMNAHWNIIDDQLKRTLINDLSRRALFSDDNTSSIASTLQALGKMQVHHSELPMDLLMQFIETQKNALSFTDFLSIVFAMKNIELPVSSLPDYVVDSMLETVKGHKDQIELKVSLRYWSVGVSLLLSTGCYLVPTFASSDHV